MTHYTILRYIAVAKFRVPAADADDLVQEAMMSILTTDARLANPRAWLIAAVCNGSRHYWRQRAHLGEPVSADLADASCTVEQIDAELLARQLLRQLPARLREVLRLHYLEGLREKELAAHLGTTPRYARKLITRALRRIRKLLAAARKYIDEHHGSR